MIHFGTTPKTAVPVVFVDGRNLFSIAIRGRSHKGIYARYRQLFQIIKILLKQIDIGGCLEDAPDNRMLYLLLSDSSTLPVMASIK